MAKNTLPFKNRVKQLEHTFKLMLAQKIEATHNRFTSWRHENDLFFSIIKWILMATAAYTLLNWIWGDRGIFSGWSLEENTSTPLERIKVSLTILGGTGGIGYLVIKFRERSALEREEANEKLVRAVQQLGDASPQVRIAGVYSLADVADTYEGLYHQRVVDILCGYLRTDRLLKDANGETRYATHEDGTPNHDQPLSTDGAVESTILSILASHLKAHSRTNNGKQFSLGSWSSCNLDLHGAYITEQVDFTDTQISEINAQDTKFSRDVCFSRSTFTRKVNFLNAKFSQHATFTGSQIVCLANFGGVTFTQLANFNRAAFVSDAQFTGTTFGGGALFIETLFQEWADFQSTKFIKGCAFFDTKHIQEPIFHESLFNIKLKNTKWFAFSESIELNEEGLPKGAKWSEFDDHGRPITPENRNRTNFTDSKDQAEKTSPTNSPLHGGDEDSGEVTSEMS
jgi:hypothetical protein